MALVLGQWLIALVKTFPGFRISDLFLVPVVSTVNKAVMINITTQLDAMARFSSNFKERFLLTWLPTLGAYTSARRVCRLEFLHKPSGG